LKSLQEISQAYAANEQLWKTELSAQCAEVEALMVANQLPVTLKMRLKTLESLSEKLGYLAKNRPTEELQVKDLLGLRIVVPFQEQVEQAVQLLRENFNTSSIERKSEKLSFREFAYDSVHVELPLQQDLSLPDCCRPVVEVQVRTILQDAWAEVEHELIYKNHLRFPNNDSIRKKLAAVNASLSLADMIFQEIRDSQKEMARWGHERFKSMLDAANAFGAPDNIDAMDMAEPQATLPGIENPDAASKAEIERNLMLALKAHNDKDFRSAVQFYSKVLASGPDLKVRSIVFNHRGIAYFMMQQESRALSDFDRSYQCDKSNYRALNYRAMVLRRMGYVDDALECFTLSLEIDPAQAEVWFLKAQTLAEIAHTESAVENLHQALALDPGHQEARALLDRLDPHGTAKVDRSG
jgi:putative GTP pyrophosphokinase